MTVTPERWQARVELRVVELSAVTVGAGAWLPDLDDVATLKAMARLDAVGYVLGGGAAGASLLDPFLVDGRLRLVYGGEWLAALRRRGETHAQVLVAPALPDDESFRLLLAHLLRPVPADATPMQIHRAERPIRELVRKAAKARQREAGRRTAAGRWGTDGGAVASADFPEPMRSPLPTAVGDVLAAAFEAVNSRGDTRSKHKLLGLTSSADEYEAIEKILTIAGDEAEDAAVRKVASEQAAALDTPQPPAISTALRRVLAARQNARAQAIAPEPAPAPQRPESVALVDAVLAALQECVERLEVLLTPRGDAASVLRRSDAEIHRFRAAASAAHEIPALLTSVAAVL